MKVYRSYGVFKVSERGFDPPAEPVHILHPVYREFEPVEICDKRLPDNLVVLVLNLELNDTVFDRTALLKVPFTVFCSLGYVILMMVPDRRNIIQMRYLIPVLIVKGMGCRYCKLYLKVSLFIREFCSLTAAPPLALMI